MVKPKQDFSLALIDMDILCYRCSVASQDDPPKVLEGRIDDLMDYCLNQTVPFASEENFEAYLTGKDNFRYQVAKSFPYKGNRSGKDKPQHLTHAREYSQEAWGATVVDGMEADDIIAIRATIVPSSVIVSIDKDFQTVPGWKYNFVKDEWIYNDKWSALQYFYTQVLTGDAVDNIKGLHRVGPKTAAKLLADSETEEDLWEACLKAYDGDYDRVVENARLLHLWRYEGEVWEPPK